PLADRSATVQAHSDDPTALARVAGRLVALPLEADCLDLAWSQGSGALLLRFAGATARQRATEAGALIGQLGLSDATVTDEDAAVADRWPAAAPGALTVMRRIKARFDPANVCAPGAFVGGL